MKEKETKTKDFLKSVQFATAKEVSDYVGISYDSARYTLNKLTEKDPEIKKEGNGYVYVAESSTFETEPDSKPENDQTKQIPKTKYGRLELAMRNNKEADRGFLMAESGFDLSNLQVAIYTLKKKHGWGVTYDRKTKVYNFETDHILSPNQ